jgi:hypothetical protein
MTFTYHYTTHSYYHLPLVFVLSVGIGLLAHAVVIFVRARRADLVSAGVATATAALVLAGTQAGAFPVIPAADTPAATNTEVAVPEKIGSLLNHATGVVFLAPSYGNTLEFYGGVAGISWPASADFNLSRIEGIAPESAQQRFDKILQTTHAKLFVVTAMHQWQAQPDLRAYLNSHFPRVATHPDYLIYDLRRAVR